MVFSFAIAYGQSPQWLPFDSGTTFTNNLYSFTYRGDLYVSEEISGYLYESVNGSWELMPSPGFGIKVSKDFNNQWWVAGDSSVAVFNGSDWTVVKTVHGQILAAEIGNDNNLYIGGSYETDNGIVNIMKTDGITFNPLDVNTPIGEVNALIVSPFNGNIQVCQGADGTPSQIITEWNGISYQKPTNEPVVFLVAESTVSGSAIYYFMDCYDPDAVESGNGHRLMHYDGTNWKRIANIDGDIDVLYPDSVGLVFSCFGNATFYGDTIPVELSGVYRLNADSTISQIGGTLYGYINTISKNADDQFVIAGYFGDTDGGPIYSNVLVLANADTTTGGTEVSANNPLTINLFPNPATSHITVSGLPVQKTDLEIFDYLGRRVALYNDVAEQVTLDVSNLSNGVYFLKTPKDVVKFIRK